MKMKDVNYNDDLAVVTEAEKVMNRGVWKSILKAIIVLVLCLIDPIVIAFVVAYLAVQIFYNQYRFIATQYYINRLDFKIKKLDERTRKLKYKITNEPYPNYIEEEIEIDFLELERLNDEWKGL